MDEPQETFPGGINTLLGQYQRRRSKLTCHEGEGLPPPDVVFHPLKKQPLPAQPLPRPEGLSRFGKKRHFLLGELPGQCELAMLHGMLISHLRKHTFPDHALALFLRLWAEEENWLLQNLSPRWLISAVITFADHGQTEADRRLAHSLKMFFSLMKLYEAERSYSGKAPQNQFRIKDRNKSPLPLGMKDFSLLRGDLEANLLAPLWQDSNEAPAIGNLVKRLLTIVNEDDGTIFRRFALMRISASKAVK